MDPSNPFYPTPVQAGSAQLQPLGAGLPPPVYTSDDENESVHAQPQSPIPNAANNQPQQQQHSPYPQQNNPFFNNNNQPNPQQYQQQQYAQQQYAQQYAQQYQQYQQQQYQQQYQQYQQQQQQNFDASNPFSSNQNSNQYQYQQQQQQPQPNPQSPYNQYPQQQNTFFHSTNNSYNQNNQYYNNNNQAQQQSNHVKQASNQVKQPSQSPQEKKQAKEAKRQRNRVRAVNEIIATEKTYISRLEELISIYLTPMKSNDKLLKSKYHSIIYPQILMTILAFNSKFLKSLEDNKQWIGRVMLEFIPYLKMYQNYMTNHESATRLIKQLRNDKNSEFTKYLLQKEIEKNGFTLESYLILPIQRLPRYELCLKEIIKLTLDTHVDKENLVKAYDKISGVNKQLNIRMKDHEQRGKVKEIEMRIINLKINQEKNKNKNKKSSFNVFSKNKKDKDVDNDDTLFTRLVQPSRIFIKDGYLTKVSRKKDIKYYFVLFNDLLIYCSENNINNKLILHQKLDITDQYFHIKRTMIIDDDIDYNDKNQYGGNKSFEIHSIQKSFLCYAVNHEIRESWCEAIETCCENIKKSGITNKKQKRSSSNNPGTGTGINVIRPNSASGSSGLGSGLNLNVKQRNSGKSIKRFHSAQNSGDGNLNEVEFAHDAGRILETAPIWIPNDFTDTCMMDKCTNTFSAILLKKRNHCRYCGKLVCSDCCSHTLPHYDPHKRKKNIYVKVCNVCFNKYKVPQLLGLDQMGKLAGNSLLNLPKINANAKNVDKNKNNINKNQLKKDDDDVKLQSSQSFDPVVINDDDDHSDSSDLWDLYGSQAKAGGIATPGGYNQQDQDEYAKVMFKISQSTTPVISTVANRAPSTDEDLFSNLFNNSKQSNIVNQANPLYSPKSIKSNKSNFSFNSSKQSGNNNNNPNYNPLLPNNNGSLSGSNNNLNRGSYSSNNRASFNSNSNQSAHSNNSGNNSNKHQKKNSFAADMNIVNSIIGNNENLLSSMNLEDFYGKDKAYHSSLPSWHDNSSNNNNNNNNNNNKSFLDNSKDIKPENINVLNAVILDENAVVDDVDSDDSDAAFANIVIPQSHQSPVGPLQRIGTNELFGFIGNNNNNNNKVLAPKINKTDRILDKSHESVKNLGAFGFSSSTIDEAWKMMGLNDKHRSIVPDHGPLFVETMLDYLGRVQKRQSKSAIMSQYSSNNNNYNNNNKDPFGDITGNLF